MKNAFDGLNNRLDMDEVKRSLGLKVSQEKSQKPKKQRTKSEKTKNRTEYPRTVGWLQKL